MNCKKVFYRSTCFCLLSLAVSLLFPAFCQSQNVEFSDDDKIFLQKIQRRALDFFLKEASLENGLVRDYARNQEGFSNQSPASIAASGFALSAYAVGVENGWILRHEGINRTKRALRFALNELENEHGFFYHFISMSSGKRAGQSELSPIDTALFIAGALFAAEYYQDPEISGLTRKLYERIDFPWMLDGGKFFALSWTPEKKFSDKKWDHYDEALLLYVLAIGSPTHPIDADAWHGLARPAGSYQSERMIAMPPLFTHQYPQIWLDLRDKHDGMMNYFNHSITACKVNRAFAIDQAETYKTYGPDAWGITASDGPKGYKAYGAPPGWAIHDGTLAPTGAGSCMPFTPKESLAALRHFESYGKKLWGRYGFADAFNDDENWVSPNVIAIDLGAMLLMIENALSGLLWKTTNRISVFQKAFEKIGFKPGSKEIAWKEPPHTFAVYAAGGIQVDGFMKDWPGGIDVITLDKNSAEFGDFRKENDPRAKIRFAWDENMLYFSAEVEDASIVARQSGTQLWRDDLLEMYIDPDGDGLYWEDSRDFQIGFRPVPGSDGSMIWSWFQKGEDPSQSGWAKSQSYSDARGYVIEGSIRWDQLGIFPRPGLEVALSPALHDVDTDRSHRKMQWFFRSEEKLKRFQLGKVILEDVHGRKK